jgi:hypothetical protein
LAIVTLGYVLIMGVEHCCMFLNGER